MRYARILSAVAGVPWAIHPEKGRAVMEFLAFAANGGTRTPDEVRAITGRASEASSPSANAATPVSEPGGIAVLALSGIISPRMSNEMDVSGPGGTSAEGFTRRYLSALNDSRVGGIIIDVDSPGGNVFGVPEAFEAVYASRGAKPVVAVVNPFTASAAFWMAAAAEEIVITPSGEIGSVGVYAYHEDLSQALAALGVTPTLVKASISPNKAEMHSSFPLTEDAKAAMQEGVDRYGRQFLADLARGRGLKASEVESRFGGGRMVGAEDAVRLGMADRIGTLDGEIRRMADHLATRPAAKQKASTTASRRRAALW